MRYALELALFGIHRSKLLSILIVLAVATGISAFATMLLIRIGLGGDPAPSISHSLYHVELDLRDDAARSSSARPLPVLSLHDVQEITRLTGVPSVATSSSWLPYRPMGTDRPLGMIAVRGFTSGAHSLLDLKLLSGAFWRSDDDQNGARVAVISRSLSRELFGSESAVGRQIELATRSFAIVGVVEDWNPIPRFHDLRGGAYAESERLYIPLAAWRALPKDYGMGAMSCRDGVPEDPESPSCAWLQLWVKLNDTQALGAFTSALHSYGLAQLDSGRATDVFSRVAPLKEWLAINDVLPDEVSTQLWFAAGVLVICLVNAAGLFLAGFVGRSREIAIRRSLGATRGDIVRQLAVHSAVLGAAGGLVSIPMVLLGFRVVQDLSSAYASHLSIAWWYVALCPLIAAMSALLSASIPLWRASQRFVSLRMGEAP